MGRNNLEIYDWIKCRKTENAKCRIEGSCRISFQTHRSCCCCCWLLTRVHRHEHYRSTSSSASSSSNYYIFLLLFRTLFRRYLFFIRSFAVPNLFRRLSFAQTTFCHLTTIQKRKKLSYSIFPIDFMLHESMESTTMKTKTTKALDGNTQWWWWWQQKRRRPNQRPLNGIACVRNEKEKMTNKEEEEKWMKKHMYFCRNEIIKIEDCAVQSERTTLRDALSMCVCVCGRCENKLKLCATVADIKLHKIEWIVSILSDFIVLSPTIVNEIFISFAFVVVRRSVDRWRDDFSRRPIRQSMIFVKSPSPKISRITTR